MSPAFTAFVNNTGPLNRLHPLTMLTMSMTLIMGGLSLPGIWLTYGLFAFVIAPLAAWGGFLQRFLRTVLVLVVPFGISLLLIQGFVRPGGTPLVILGPIALKIEGLVSAATGIGRITVFMSSFLLLTFSTSPDALVLALTERGLPGSIAYIILTTIQIVPRFQVRAQQILDAQRSRGLETEGSLIRRARALLPLVVPLVLGSIVDIEERAIALEARAFSRQGAKTSLLVLHDTRLQRAARWLMIAAVLAVVIWRVVPGGLR